MGRAAVHGERSTSETLNPRSVSSKPKDTLRPTREQDTDGQKSADPPTDHHLRLSSPQEPCKQIYCNFKGPLDGAGIRDHVSLPWFDVGSRYIKPKTRSAPKLKFTGSFIPLG